MTDQEINRILAEKVMGWTGYSVKDFDPLNNISQAMECLNKKDWYVELTRSNTGAWTCSIFTNGNNFLIGSGCADTPERAICLAIMKALEE